MWDGAIIIIIIVIIISDGPALIISDGPAQCSRSGRTETAKTAIPDGLGSPSPGRRGDGQHGRCQHGRSQRGEWLCCIGLFGASARRGRERMAGEACNGHVTVM